MTSLVQIGITGSKLPLAETCIGSVIFEALDLDEHIRGLATRGRAIHAFIAAAADFGRSHALDMVAKQWRPLCEVIPLERLPLHLTPELALAWDVDTGDARVLGLGLGRDYSGARPRELVGTIDLGGLARVPDAVHAEDHKTGGWVARAQTNLQVGLAAVALSRIHDRPRALVALAYIDEDGEARLDEGELDAWDLGETADRLRAIVARAVPAHATYREGGDVRLNPGPWCGRCPARFSCPETTFPVEAFARPVFEQLAASPALAKLVAMSEKVADKALTEFASEFDKRARLSLSPGERIARLQVLRRAFHVIERVIGAEQKLLDDMAFHGPIELPDGQWREWRPVREYRDGDALWRQLAEDYGEAKADRAVTWVAEATVKSVNAAARMVAAERARSIVDVEREIEAKAKAAGILVENMEPRTVSASTHAKRKEAA